MWDDEQDLRAALQRVVDVDVPPPGTTRVEDVIRRGRRRVLITRIGTVAGAIVAVVGIGVGASALGNLGVGADRLPPAGPAVSTPPVPLPESPRPGWVTHEPTYVPAPPSPEEPGVRGPGMCAPITLPPASGREVLPEEKYLPVLLDELAKHYPGDAVHIQNKTWVNVNRGLADVAVYSKDKQVQRTFSMMAGRYGGPLEQAAEYYASVNSGGCAQKMHWLNLPGGAILQATPDGIRAFTRSGRWYQITGYEVPLAYRGGPKDDGKSGPAALPENVIVDLLTRLAALG
ncbi:hypothetical protein NLX83_10100 [Allokutzneria sp. A3M-2-11 16]|uniref:hypothetical protein n=1 Tax=Allokutzneria sp. A3M-2-11 16 TaxID=2962043 RepID=UPI0020B70D4F|nr:hypothetical protein [Allokutzneria sp. A3M-2-11 16]MCP3799607.1 hypothetical protein [Allokutzneria sp. A3M-2-11 16]